MGQACLHALSHWSKATHHWMPWAWWQCCCLGLSPRGLIIVMFESIGSLPLLEPRQLELSWWLESPCSLSMVDGMTTMGWATKGAQVHASILMACHFKVPTLRWMPKRHQQMNALFVDMPPGKQLLLTLSQKSLKGSLGAKRAHGSFWSNPGHL